MNIDALLSEMKNISPVLLQYLNARLEEWASWSLKEDNPRLDFSKINLIYRLIVLGSLPPEKPGLKPLPVHKEAEEIEMIISIMATKDMNCAQALREYYIGRGRRSQQYAARNMGLSVRQFQYHFKNAFSWLEGWFTGQYAAHLVKKVQRENINKAT